MPLKLNEIKSMVDIDYSSGYDTRLKASDDRVFYFITQLDDWLIENTQLGYLGEFDLLKKAGRQIVSDLAENHVQVDFIPEDLTRQDAADTLDGIYRTDDSKNTSIEAYENAKLDTVVCGVGAWEIYTEYSSLRNYNDQQVIRRRPLQEAVNTVFWDANAKLLDKSDASRVVALVAYSEDGYRDFVSELTGEDPEDVTVTTFKEPENSFTFPWVGTGESAQYYVGNFYHRKKITTKLLTMIDAFGEEKQFLETQIFDVIDELIDTGWEKVSEKDIIAWEVRKYIVSGSEILNGEIGEDGEREGEVIAGEHLPIIPVYGEHTFVEGEEHYEGFVRLAKDPQRLRNFVFNYIADFVSRSPRKKPTYGAEQIAGLEKFYSETGSEDNYPYRIQHLKDKSGQPLPLGPLNMAEPEQQIPQAVATLIPLTRESVEDVAPSMMPKEISDPSVQIANKTVARMQASISEQSTIYQQHFAHAKRRDAEVYASMAADVYDVPRRISLTLPDGTRKDSEVMKSVVDEETGNEVILNDLASTEFEVTTKIGPAYSSQKEQAVDRMTALMQGMQPGDPKRTILELEIMAAIDGVGLEEFREYARKELILMGIKKPETEEEIAMLDEAKNKPKEPSAEMILAQGELLKGQAAKEKNQIESMKVQVTAQNEQMKRMIDEFKAATDRINSQVSAQEAGANINYKRVDTMGKELDNAAKAKELQTPDFSTMSNDDLFKEMMNAG